jgi:Uma2 family endonuclease
MTAVETLNVQQAVKLRVEDFVLLSEHDAFKDYGKVELIEGEIVALNAQFRPHVRAKMAVYEVLRAALEKARTDLVVFTEASVSLLPDSMPEPDVVVTDAPDGDGPLPSNSIRLVVEVSDTTLTTDLGVKCLLYARHGLPEYWVVDLAGACLHQMLEPHGGDYRQKRQIGFGDLVLSPITLGVGIKLPTHF